MLSYLIATLICRISYLYYRPRLQDALVVSKISTRIFVCRDKSVHPTPPPAVYIICPETIEEVQSAVRCAQKAVNKVLIRSGALFLISGTYEGLILDLSRFSDIDYDKETHMVTVGAGVRLGALDMKIFQKGKRVFPHSGFPRKVITGHVLLGGFGYLSRMHGLAVDSVVSMKVVLADASVVTASVTENKDLFWALCGAGTSFGVVVELTLKTYPAPENIVLYKYQYRYNEKVPWKMTQALMTVRRFVESEPAAELGIGVEITPGGVFVLKGVYFGTLPGFVKEAHDLILALNDIYKPAEIMFVKKVSWMQLIYALPEGKRIPIDDDGTVGESFTVHVHKVQLYESRAKPVTIVNIFSLFFYLFMVASNYPIRWCVVIDLHGGKHSAIANNRPLSTDPTSTSCYGHRDCWFMYQFCAVQNLDDNADFIHSFVEIMAASFSRDSSSFDGPVHSRFEAHLEDELYYGNAGEKLEELKYRFDRDEMFDRGFATEE